MEGFPGDTPILVKNINSSNMQILSLGDLYKKFERKNSNIKNWRVWSPDGWNKILEIRKGQTELDIHRISNCYNWLYATEKIRFLLGIRDVIEIKDIFRQIFGFRKTYVNQTTIYVP